MLTVAKLYFIMLSVIMLSVDYWYADCCYDERRYVKCRRANSKTSWYISLDIMP
jgi:hypothetical protein